MKIGKMSGEQLKRFVFDNLKASDAILGAGEGIDSAVLKMNGLIAVSTDPITAADEGAGALAVIVSANDVAAVGAVPKYMLVTLLLPPSVTEERLMRLCRELADTANQMGIAIVGGHTEVTDAVNRVVISSTVFGQVKKLVRNDGARVGDGVVLVGYAGHEGSVILSDRVKLDEEEKKQIERLKATLSIAEAASIAAPYCNAMHDVTEGGVLGAAYELASSAGKGIKIELAKIPVLPVTRRICDAFKIDPFRLISSGALIAATNRPEALIAALRAKNIAAERIGVILNEGFWIKNGDNAEILEAPRADELFSAK